MTNNIKQKNTNSGSRYPGMQATLKVKTWVPPSVGKILWMLENVLKHKSCLDPLIKNYDLIDFTLTYTKCGIE